MQYKYCFETVHRMLADICSNDRSLFGGVPTVFGGDFAQILPVVPRGNRADIVNACLQRSFLWSSLRVLSLRLNMRVRNGDRNIVWKQNWGTSIPRTARNSRIQRIPKQFPTP